MAAGRQAARPEDESRPAFGWIGTGMTPDSLPTFDHAAPRLRFLSAGIMAGPLAAGVTFALGDLWLHGWQSIQFTGLAAAVALGSYLGALFSRWLVVRRMRSPAAFVAPDPPGVGTVVARIWARRLGQGRARNGKLVVGRAGLAFVPLKALLFSNGPVVVWAWDEVQKVEARPRLPIFEILCTGMFGPVLAVEGARLGCLFDVADARCAAENIEAVRRSVVA